MGNNHIISNINNMELEINDREIQPLSLWFNGGIRTANIFRVDNFSNYTFTGDGGFAHWVMFEYKEVERTPEPTEEVPEPESEIVLVKTPLADGEVKLPHNLIANWGADDQLIFDYVMQEINVKNI